MDDSQFQWRSMQAADLAAVIDLIRSVNEDDAEAAVDSYKDGLEGQYVLSQPGKLAGVTGSRPIPGTDRSHWLSWTYLDWKIRDVRVSGNSLLEFLIGQLRQQNARQLFAMVSGQDAPVGSIRSYGGGDSTYLEFGFKFELQQRNYYDRFEDLTILSYRIQEEYDPCEIEDEHLVVRFLDSDEIPETDDAYYLDWEFVDNEVDLDDGLEHWLKQIRGWKGRVAFVGVPHFAQTALNRLLDRGFHEEGQLSDLHEDGVHETRLRFDL